MTEMSSTRVVFFIFLRLILAARAEKAISCAVADASLSSSSLLVRGIETLGPPPRQTVISRSVHLCEQPDGNVKEIQPHFFHRARRCSGISERAYMSSLVQGASPFQSNSLKSRSSESEFFFSLDKRFMIKAIGSLEAAQLLRMLPAYVRHLERHPDSLLCRICGMYSLGPSARYYLVMLNTLSPHDVTHRIFDLKGSTLGRTALKQKLEKERVGIVLKDLDFSNADCLYLSNETRFALLHQLHFDVEFLESFSVMDYSMLIGICHESKMGRFRRLLSRISLLSLRKRRRTKRDVLGELKSRDPRVYYFLGIIDFLQPFNRMKFLESYWKRFLYGKKSVSCVDPKFYAARFLQFAENAVAPATLKS